MMSVFAVFSVCNVYGRTGPVQVCSGLCPQCEASVVYTASGSLGPGSEAHVVAVTERQRYTVRPGIAQLAELAVT